MEEAVRVINSVSGRRRRIDAESRRYTGPAWLTTSKSDAQPQAVFRVSGECHVSAAMGEIVAGFDGQAARQTPRKRDARGEFFVVDGRRLVAHCHLRGADT